MGPVFTRNIVLSVKITFSGVNNFTPLVGSVMHLGHLLSHEFKLRDNADISSILKFDTPTYVLC